MESDTKEGFALPTEGSYIVLNNGWIPALNANIQEGFGAPMEKILYMRQY